MNIGQAGAIAGFLVSVSWLVCWFSVFQFSVQKMGVQPPRSFRGDI